MWGLILSGGFSTRMKHDKALLNYHGTHQLGYCYELLSAQCEHVYVSCRADQAQQYADFPQIHDQYAGIGPLSGILAAFDHQPAVAWLVLAIDLPLVNPRTIDYLIRNRNPDKRATAFVNPEKGFPEPLCTIYEPTMQPILENARKNQQYSIRKVLGNNDIHKIISEDHHLLNCNTPEEYQAIKHSEQRHLRR